MVYSNCRIYGPYERKEDNYSHVIILFYNGTRTTVSYAKYLMECHIGRYLLDNEEVHHKDENPQNNDLSNLEIKIKSEHRGEHSQKYYDCIIKCDYCERDFLWTAKQQSEFNRNMTRIKKRGSGRGPFCSKRCAGKMGKM